MKVTGAVIVFDDDVSPAEAERILRAIQEVASADIREFNPEYGDPVFYVP